MDVKNASFTPFTAKLITPKPNELHNSAVRPLVDFLRHNCGGNESSHAIRVGKHYISVCSNYVISKATGEKKCLTRKKNFNIWPFSINNKLVNKAIKWAKETTFIAKDIKIAPEEKVSPLQSLIWENYTDFSKY